MPGRATVSRVPLYQQVYLELREKILSGELLPGSRVDVQSVADVRGVSRTPTREAIRQLIQEGLLESDRDGRAYVFNPSIPVLADIYLVRASLEAVSAAVLAANHDQIDFSILVEACNSCTHAVKSNDWRGIVDATTAWHEGLVSLASNPTAMKFLESSKAHILRHRALSMRVSDRAHAACDTHMEILALIQAGDVQSAQEKVFKHVLAAGRWAIEHLAPDTGSDTYSMRFLRSYD